MKEITNIKNLDFKSWNNIKQNQKQISVCWGKTFFYYDSNKGKLYYENISIFGRILRKIFGYKKKYNQKNLWTYLTSKKIVIGESPSKGFRKVVGEKLQKLSSLRTKFFQKIDKRNSSEDESLELFKHGLDINVYDKNPSNTALHNALENLIRNQQQPSDEKFEMYEHPSEELEEPKNPKKIIEAILEKKPDLNVPNKIGLTPLYLACKAGVLEVVKKLVDNGADINGVEPPIFAAIMKGNHELVIYLIENSAKLNFGEERKDWWETPLTIAAKNGEINLVQLLIDKGGEVNQGGGTIKMTPLHIATEQGNLELVTLFLNNGADINQGDRPFGRTALYYALEGKKFGIAKFLINQGAQVNSTCGFGRTLLHVAVASGNMKLVKLLLDKDAGINSQDIWGLSPLHSAVEKGYKEIEQVLLERGENPKIKDRLGKTPQEFKS